jgi:Holliday junction resolvase
MPNPYAEALGLPTKETKAGKPRKKLLNASQKRAKKQEKEQAQVLRAQRVVASGSGVEKGDVRKRGLLRLECKTTKHASFSVTREMVRKIEEAALSSGEMPAIVVEFNDNGKKVMEVAVVPLYALQEICQVK